jgi:flavorubredoxin
MLVPQHGAPIVGSQAIQDFYNWVESLQCGVDLFDQRNYQLPTASIDTQGRRGNPLLRVA